MSSDWARDSQEAVSRGLSSLTNSNPNNFADVELTPASNYILVPTSFTLNISRNLSASWFRDRPDLEVSGKINAINVSFIKSYLVGPLKCPSIIHRLILLDQLIGV